MAKYLDMALAGLPRHREVGELRGELVRCKAYGYTGIWVENDYVTDRSAMAEAHQAFPGNWQLLDIFDFTHGEQGELYQAYLDQLCDLCGELGLDVYVSFWMPRLEPATLRYVQRHHPGAIGASEHIGGGRAASLCTCAGGEGLAFIAEMVERFVRRFPRVVGLKLATEDNAALLCESFCPNAGGTRRADHAANLFRVVQQAMARVGSTAQLLIYPWFWKPDFMDSVLDALAAGFSVVTKFEQHARQRIEGGSGEALFDSSIVAECAGEQFLRWRRRVGAERLIDMLPVGTGIDDFFLANPPYPARVYRRLCSLGERGVRAFMDFECGGHCAGACEEAVAVFSKRGAELDAAQAVEIIAGRVFSSPLARNAAIEGWSAFDQGFAELPIGLGNTGLEGFSGRIGFAWSMCIATPMLREWFGGDRGHMIHWFSPYNFFHGELAGRLQRQFEQVETHWRAAWNGLETARRTELTNGFAEREAVSALAHLMSVESVLNWCHAAACIERDDLEAFDPIAVAELELTRRFEMLVGQYGWVWENNCWHPHRTPLSQRGIWAERPAGAMNVFAAKIRRMEQAAELLNSTHKELPICAM